MRNTLLALLLGTALIAVGLACGDSEDEPDLTLSEYFAQFEEIVLAGCSGIETVRSDAQQTPTVEHPSDEERVGSMRRVLESGQGVLASVVAELREVRSPNDVREAHDAYIDALAEQGELTEAWLESDRFPAYVLALAAADSIDDFREASDLAAGAELAAAEDLQEEAGRELGSVARANGIDFDTSCSNLYEIVQPTP